jgi:hypothetical protein
MSFDSSAQRKSLRESSTKRMFSPEGKITNRGRGLILDEGREGSPCDVNQGVVVAAFEDPIPGAVAVPNV